VNGSGKTFSFSDPTLSIANGIKKVKIKKKKGLWEFQVQAKDVNAAITGDEIYVVFQVGGQCIERARECELKNETLKCS
jgi:hypothetical protein